MLAYNFTIRAKVVVVNQDTTLLTYVHYQALWSNNMISTPFGLAKVGLWLTTNTLDDTLVSFIFNFNLTSFSMVDRVIEQKMLVL